MDQFPVPARRQDFECEIRRSRFLTCVDAIDGRAAALELVADMRARWPDANHHCWAYLGGRPGDLRDADKSDDGEPRGTAGRPILNVLEHSGLGRVAVVVTRYFGGIKLGAGGLARAYGGCVGDALRTLETRVFRLTRAVTIVVPYPLLASVEHWLASERIDVRDKLFAEAVTLTLDVPCQSVEPALAVLTQLGHGTITVCD
jgi:uncharacterized YigZ family protein